jgi:diguanylate cyclase (GGDEF)-like protein
MADGDMVRAETSVNAIFDRGYYQSIRVVTIRGDTIIIKSLPITSSKLPPWFTSLIKLEAPVSESMISKGWQQLGRVIVSSHPQFAYQQLWHTTIWVSLWLLAFYIFSLLLSYLFLKSILSPLEEIEEVAHAISARNFKVVKATPKSRELLAVVSAINTLSNKVRSAIEIGVSTASYLRVEANTDDLTKLDNRRSFEHQTKAILDNQPDIVSGAIFLVQIDNFKEFNSLYGYRAGDELLKSTGSILESSWGERNFVRSRINGATFAVAAFDLSLEEATQFGWALCTRLGGEIETEQFGIPISFGCGGVFFIRDRVTLEGLMAEADMAMLQSISKGNNDLVLLVHASEAEDANKGSLFWKQYIVNALDQNRLALVAQPVVAFNDPSRQHFEIFGRLIDEKGELIPASKFMPMAIRHNLTTTVDMKLMEKLFHVMSERHQPTAHFAINLSVRSINHPELLDWLTISFSKHPEFASRIIFEFSEFGVVQELDSMSKFVSVIRGLGADFAVDNFGLHRAAFEYLQTLRPAYIKLSPIFITDLQENHANQFFISSVAKITKPLEIKIFAHSIENDAILEILEKLGVDGYQGFATGIPIQID